MRCSEHGAGRSMDGLEQDAPATVEESALRGRIALRAKETRLQEARFKRRSWISIFHSDVSPITLNP